MKKFTNIGLSATVAFALVFATSINVVAQEKISGSDKVEAKESIEARIFANTIHQLSDQLSAMKASVNAPSKVIGEAPTTKVVHQADRPVLATRWFQYNGPTPDEAGVGYDDEIRDPSNYSPVNLDDPTDEPDCNGDEQICGVEAEEGSTPSQPDQDALDDLIDDYDNKVNSGQIVEKDIEQ